MVQFPFKDGKIQQDILAVVIDIWMLSASIVDQYHLLVNMSLVVGKSIQSMENKI